MHMNTTVNNGRLVRLFLLLNKWNSSSFPLFWFQPPSGMFFTGAHSSFSAHGFPRCLRFWLARTLVHWTAVSHREIDLARKSVSTAVAAKPSSKDVSFLPFSLSQNHSTSDGYEDAERPGTAHHKLNKQKMLLDGVADKMCCLYIVRVCVYACMRACMHMCVCVRACICVFAVPVRWRPLENPDKSH